MKYSAVVLAAGKGTRTNLEYNKVFYKFKDGEILLNKTVSIFLEDEDCSQIIVVTTPNEMEYVKTLFNDIRIEYVFGGDTRQDSVHHGVEKVKNDYVMIHDGARCFVDKESIERCKKTLEKEDACLLMVPVVDTIKKVVDGYVVSTPLRKELYAAQTPQCFKTSLISDCLNKAKECNFVGSDDASLVEKFANVKVLAVEGNYANKKVTTPEDLD